MSQVIENAKVNNNQADQRIFARLGARISWEDKGLGEILTIEGITKNIGRNSASVELDVLPPVGEELTLRLLDGEKQIITVKASVIRVERDPSKRGAALYVEKNRDEWVETVLPAAQDWVTNDIKVNYEGDDWLN